MRATWLLLLLVGTASGQALPGTGPLTRTGDLAAHMVDGMHRYLDDRLAAYGKSSQRTPGTRQDLLRIIGAVDSRVPNGAPVVDMPVDGSPVLAQGSGYDVFAVRWPVLDGVEAEGLLLKPRGAPRAHAVALPDADWTPEMLAGLAAGLPGQQQFARRLAESGFQVLVPALIDRSDEFSGKEGVGWTNQPHREFIFRMAYEMGRHIIGYEVQKVLAAVDWLSRQAGERPVGVFGYGEGGLLALYSAAVDERIAATVVSGYFGPRQPVWQEPIYRSVWSQLPGFGDAELAALVRPRTLIIEASPHPAVSGPPPERTGRRTAAPGRLITPPLDAVREEFLRARSHYEAQGAAGRVALVEGGPASGDALNAFAQALAPGTKFAVSETPPQLLARPTDVRARQRRQHLQLVEHVQGLVRKAEFTRRDFWAKADFSSLDGYRRQLWEEVIGRMPGATEPLAAETRLIYDTPSFRGYETVLPVWQHVYAYGVLLVPKDLKPGERRPVVVCQHGLEGRPQFLIDPPDARREEVYRRFAARLAERGFIVFAPQNPYIGGERFRSLLRKSHPLKLSLFSFIIGQHDRTLTWLRSLPFVDAERIGFYGLSYGGKTAMRVPSLLPGYALSICSADFNEWIWKITSVDHRFSYMYTVEYDMLEFNLGNTFNYAEMAWLISPRPFMVERGHRDGVGIDEWVAYEYARVQRKYADLKIPDRTEIEYFDGPHRIHGEGTFRFLHRHLNWPEPEVRR